MSRKAVPDSTHTAARVITGFKTPPISPFLVGDSANATIAVTGRAVSGGNLSFLHHIFLKKLVMST
jgi:hypothetical protein